MPVGLQRAVTAGAILVEGFVPEIAERADVICVDEYRIGCLLTHTLEKGP